MSEDTVEGAETAAAIRSTLEGMIDGKTLNGAAIPLMREIMDIVCADAPLDIPWDGFFAWVPVVRINNNRR